MKSDWAMAEPVHRALETQNCLPNTPMLDGGYVDAEALVSSQTKHQQFRLCQPTARCWHPIQYLGPGHPTQNARAESFFMTVKKEQQPMQLVDDLLKLKLTRVYLEYWTCYRLLFQSNASGIAIRWLKFLPNWVWSPDFTMLQSGSFPHFRIFTRYRR
jgi:hypothetical protein